MKVDRDTNGLGVNNYVCLVRRLCDPSNTVGLGSRLKQKMQNNYV